MDYICCDIHYAYLLARVAPIGVCMIIAIESKEDIVTCASCKHCYVSLANLLFGARHLAKCQRTERSTMTYDPVTGKTFKKVSIDYCGTERGDYGRRGECGPQGVHWVPKKTKDVFKALRKS